MELININKIGSEIYINKYSYYLDISFKYNPNLNKYDYLKLYKKHAQMYLNIKFPYWAKHYLFKTEIINNEIIRMQYKTSFNL